MYYLYFVMPAAWFLYLSAYELKVQSVDKKLKEEGHLVNPDFKILSHLRYVTSLPVTLILALVALMLAIFLPATIINVGFAMVILFLANPLLNWVAFYLVSRYMITKAKLEKLGSKLEG